MSAAVGSVHWQVTASLDCGREAVGSLHQGSVVRDHADGNCSFSCHWTFRFVLPVSDGSAIFKGCFHRPDNVTLALPVSAVIQNMSVDKCVDMCTERVRGRRVCVNGLFVDVCSVSWQLYFRRNRWLCWLEIDVTAASRLLCSLSTSWRMRTCVSTAATGKSLRAVEMTSTLWCTRHRFKVNCGSYSSQLKSRSNYGHDRNIQVQ